MAVLVISGEHKLICVEERASFVFSASADNQHNYEQGESCDHLGFLPDAPELIRIRKFNDIVNQKAYRVRE